MIPSPAPQSGLADAEMVIEELVEGGVTRFICFFLANQSVALGPNRSVRPSDIDITLPEAPAHLLGRRSAR